MQSLNGIFINLRRIQQRTPVCLNHGDIVGVGGFVPNDSEFFVFQVVCDSLERELGHFAHMAIHNDDQDFVMQ